MMPRKTTRTDDVIYHIGTAPLTGTVLTATLKTKGRMAKRADADQQRIGQGQHHRKRGDDVEGEDALVHCVWK